jgi:hypothetical protein
MKEESARLWNQYLRTICADPTSTASVRLAERDYKGFVELYAARFGPSTARTRPPLSAFLAHLFDQDLPLSSRIINQRARVSACIRNLRRVNGYPPSSADIKTAVKDTFIHSLLAHFDRFIPPS